MTIPNCLMNPDRRSTLAAVSDAPARLRAAEARPLAPANPETVRVLLVDDHAIIRAGLKSLLRTVPDIAVVGEAAGGEEAIEVAARLCPDVVIMDLEMARGDGVAATRALAEQVPGTRVLVLTVHTDRERLQPLLEAGARGYLGKDVAERELVDAIRVVAGGEVYVRPTRPRPVASPVVRGADGRAGTRARYDALSDRERTVLRMVAEGYNSPEIGRQLGITAKTVDTYKHRIEEKLGLAHRTGYVRFALNAGLLGR